MIKCETCGADFVLGTLFCTECGATLYEEKEGETSRQRRYVHFLIMGNGRKMRIPLSVSEPITIGRADPDANYWPKLDLTDDGGAEKGVSRQHALVELTSGEATLIDLTSVNGTWINDVKVDAERAYPLPASSRLRFGRLFVHIFLE